MNFNLVEMYNDLLRFNKHIYSIHRLNHFPINFKINKYDWRIYTKNRKENIKPQI